MTRKSVVRQRIAGGIIGLVVGTIALGSLGALLAGVYSSGRNLDIDDAGAGVILIIGLSLLTGPIVGAAAGSSMVHDAFGHRGSFCKAMLGAMIGLVVGLLPAAFLWWTPYALPFLEHDAWWLPYSVAIVAVCATVVAGAVLCSGWKTKAADAAKAQS